ncbi:MAG: hypothetical protein JXM68_01455 [Sedimentisphaerales bacterium]|nr:hypothetical protein [Sedimentisphaerales bacterium]
MNDESGKNMAVEVLTLLARQKELYGRLRNLAFTQRELVLRSDPEMLLKVLANRQKIINQLTLVDTQLRPIRESWQEIASGFSEVQRKQVNVLVDDVKKCIEEILSRDKDDSEKLEEKKEEIAVELKKVRTCRQMSKVYQNVVDAGSSKYCDVGG